MTHTARIAAVLGSLSLGSLTGCMDVGPAHTGGVDDTTRRESLGITCEGRVAISGTFTRAREMPADVAGCWPVGHWEFTATLEDSDCATDPVMAASYSFDVERLEVGDEEVDTSEDPEAVAGRLKYTLNTNPTGRYRLSVSSGGSGLCEGGLEIFSQNGLDVLTLKPQLNADGTLTGFGEFTSYTTNQWW